MQYQYNVLLVEDDDVDIMTVERSFNKANICNPLFKAKNGIEALDLLLGRNGKQQIQKPIIILLDLNMPQMGGLEFIQEKNKIPSLRNIPVVVLTSSSDEQDVCKSYEASVAGYMTKPVGMENFVEKMAALGKYWSLCEVC